MHVEPNNSPEPPTMSSLTAPPADNHTHAPVEKDLGIEHEHIDDHTKSTTIAGHLAHQLDHEETPIIALKSHPLACLWVLYAIWVLMATSFDNNASSNILGIPQFRKDFGHFYQGDYVLPAKWQSAYSGGPAAATVIGAFGCGSGSSSSNSDSRGAHADSQSFLIRLDESW